MARKALVGSPHAHLRETRDILLWLLLALVTCVGASNKQIIYTINRLPFLPLWHRIQNVTHGIRAHASYRSQIISRPYGRTWPLSLVRSILRTIFAPFPA